MSIAEDTFDIYKKITGYNVQPILDGYISFMDNDFKNIFNYYSGDVNSFNQESFDFLDYLTKEFFKSISCNA